MDVTGEQTVRRIAKYERRVSKFWLLLGVLQILSCVACIAGVWNIFASLTMLKQVPRIEARCRHIPGEYENLAPYVTMGAINAVLGGGLGLVLLGVDLYIRHLILSNAHLFTSEEH